MKDATQWVRDRGGVVPTSALAAAGIGRGPLDRAISSGSLDRVRRGWVAMPDADPLLIAAARSNVVITCVSRAKQLGWWVTAEDPRVHVAASAHSGRAPTATAVVHWSTPVVPRHPASLTDAPENVLAAVAACQPFESALAIWESALRKGAVDADMLRRLSLPACARRILGVAEIWSDSGLETIVVPRLRWLNLPLRRQIWLCGHRVDLLIGERLVLQIDGAHHVGPQREEDIAHDAALMLRGYHVIRVGYWQVIQQWEHVQELVMRAIAQGLHRAK
jgi:very-short-patch-repair endonuclease